MVIGVCGYGYSGSGAVLDLLREIKDCCCVFPDQEFLLPYTPGGIEDLEYQLMQKKTRYFSSDAAIKSFLKLVYAMDSPRSMYRKCARGKFRPAARRLIQEITQVSWRGTYYNDAWRRDQPYQFLWRLRNRFVDAYEKMTRRRWSYSPNTVMYLSVEPDNFYSAVHDFLHEVITMLGYDWNKIVLLNQPFDIYEPERSMKYFDDPIAVIVDRDPRDLYVLAKKNVLSRAAFMPTADVYQFIRYHRLVRQRGGCEEQSNIIRMQYEDLIYKYDETSKGLLRRLGLEKLGRNVNQYFDPSVSIENTQLFLRYPDLQEDIKMIERELPEFLYHFEWFDAKPRHMHVPF